MAGHFLLTVVAFLGGFGYWLYIIHKDRSRKLVGMESGVMPSSENFNYSSNKIGSVLELMQMWVDAMPEESTPVERRKSVSFGEETDLKEWKEEKNKPKDVKEKVEKEGDSESDKENKKGGGVSVNQFNHLVNDKETKPILKTGMSEMSLMSVDICKEALEQGVGVIHSLLTSNKQEGVLRSVARRAIDDRCAEVLVQVMQAHPKEVVLAAGLQILMHLATDPENKDQIEVAKRVELQKLLELLGSPNCRRYEPVMRRGLQVVGTLCEVPELQDKLGELGGIDLTMKVIKENPTSTAIGVWGCWTLFHLTLQNEENIKLALNAEPTSVLDLLDTIMESFIDHEEVLCSAGMVLCSVTQSTDDLIKAHNKSLIAKMANISTKHKGNKQLKQMTKGLFDHLVKCNMQGHNIE
eukprot:CAMPEP_0197850992 /NCGR_PEP_ID=MMETSP1438-20131217/16948_1 /TAXON_ID=1461541 /ORGANISM="Pterosperma sp., Strain CCMP1384" /LENGTH=409 /DNA_ID=CAMNT_0043464441 /DNA_START=353 /DNA_END=1582 /DNA_ORIENTATION=+